MNANDFKNIAARTTTQTLPISAEQVIAEYAYWPEIDQHFYTHFRSEPVTLKQLAATISLRQVTPKLVALFDAATGVFIVGFEQIGNRVMGADAEDVANTLLFIRNGDRRVNLQTPEEAEKLFDYNKRMGYITTSQLALRDKTVAALRHPGAADNFMARLEIA